MIVSIGNLKGGTGKTTTAVNLGSALAMGGHNVLIIDLVPRGDATFSLGAHRASASYCLLDVILRGLKMEKAILGTSVSGLFIVPSSPELINADLELASRKGRESVLKENLTGYLKRDFDCILLDCPSTVNLLLVNALIASDFLLIPATPSILSVRGLHEILRIQEELKRNMDCGVEFMGILLTMVDYRSNAVEEIIGNLRSSFGRNVFNTTIERIDSLMGCPGSHTPILQAGAGSPAARSFMKLSEEFISRLRGRNELPGRVDGESGAELAHGKIEGENN